MNDNKDVLVILASYNGEKYISEQINSILNQYEVNVEIIVSDDCSRDNTQSIVKGINNPNVTLHVNQINSGNAAQNFLNALLTISDQNLSKYSFIAFADQDDIWLPNKLARAIEKLESTNDQLYVSNLTLWDDSTDDKKLLRKDFSQKKYDYLFEGGSAGCTYVFSTQFAFKIKEVLSKIELNNWKYFSHDWLVYFIARNLSLGVFIDTESHILYRIHSSNVHGQLNVMSKDSIQKRINLVREGWYIEQIKGFEQLLTKNSVEYKIYELYKRSLFTRLIVLIRYNFSLMRSKKKFIVFFLLSLLPQKK